jgi:hypothetical protein
MNFFFGIPLRGRATAKNWDRVCKLLDITLGSVLAQTDPDFRVLLACHDIPNVEKFADPRINVIKAEFPPILAVSQQMRDRELKRWLIGERLRVLGGGYLMMVDADDLVSNRVVEFVRRDAYPHGYILKSGYELNFATGRVHHAPRFDRLCGGCAIFHLSPDDLPSSIGSESPCFFQLFQNHTKWNEVAARQNRPFKVLPFRGAMYVTNNGENHSLTANNVGWRRRLIRKLIPGGPPGATLRKEFGIPTILRSM